MGFDSVICDSAYTTHPGWNWHWGPVDHFAWWGHSFWVLLQASGTSSVSATTCHHSAGSWQVTHTPLLSCNGRVHNVGIFLFKGKNIIWTVSECSYSWGGRKTDRGLDGVYKSKDKFSVKSAQLLNRSRNPTPLLYLCSKETGWYLTVSHKAILLVNIQGCSSSGWILTLRRALVFCTHTLSCSSNPGSRLLPLSIMYRRPLVWLT